MTAVDAHLRNNTLISAIISMAISACFFLLVFGFRPIIALFAPDGLALDFIPQTLFAGFMAALVPGLQTRGKMVAGTLPGTPPSARAVVTRAAMLAAAGLVLAAIVTGLLTLSGVTVLNWSAAFGLKIVYGGLLGMIVTQVALRMLLGSSR